jgi:hypothetical protein
MDQGRTESAFAIVTPAGMNPTFAWSPDGKTLTATPAGVYGYTQQVQWRVGAAAADLAGNALGTLKQYDFTTTLGPIVTFASPDAGSGWAINQAMVVTFNEAMDPTATNAAISVVSPSGVTLSYTWSGDGGTVTATPTTNFLYGQLVTWQVGTGAKDPAGNALLAPQQYTYQVRRQFTTTLAPITSGDLTSPTPTLTSSMFVGDWYNQTYSKGFLVYTLPSNAQQIQSSTLTVYQTINAGYPFAGSVAIYVEGIPYTAPISGDEWSAGAFCVGTFTQCIVFPTPPCAQAEVLSATAAASNGEARTVATPKFNSIVASGMNQPARTFALRIRRGTTSNCADYGSNGDATNDYVRFYDPADTIYYPRLTITYTAP